MGKTAEKTWAEQYRSQKVGAVIFLAIVMFLKPDLITFGFFEFWNIRGSVTEWLWTATPIFAWAISVNVFMMFCGYNNDHIDDPKEILLAGTLISARAGISEEFWFRWILFLSSIGGLKITNFIMFGLPAWLHVNIFGQVANLATLGLMKDLIFHPAAWSVGGCTHCGQLTLPRWSSVSGSSRVA